MESPQAILILVSACEEEGHLADSPHAKTCSICKAMIEIAPLVSAIRKLERVLNDLSKEIDNEEFNSGRSKENPA
jgi:transcription initiation factor IIE alpha subunit